MPAQAKAIILGDALLLALASIVVDYASLLARKTGWHVVNADVPGNTTANGLERLPAILAVDHIDLLIIALGGNDFIQHLPLIFHSWPK
ncbi:MAG: hypothetical protein EXR38_00880 [Methylotenera sp.]|nr:hypothetical protein [Methylotenera sp.]MSP99064.1 hypothetical protein [Methylotenera sp.]